MSSERPEPGGDAEPKQPSEEVDERQLELAGREGEAYQEAVDYMATEVAHVGGKRHAGDYIVGFAQEEAEGLYEFEDGEFEWTEPAEDENAHIEVVVADGADGRFVPYCGVEATLTRDDGERVGPFEVPFLWHPGLYHYGRNVALPGGGTYDLTVRIDPPTFGRHDEKNGRRYGEPVEVTFRDVDVRTGRH